MIFINDFLNMNVGVGGVLNFFVMFFCGVNLVLVSFVVFVDVEEVIFVVVVEEKISVVFEVFVVE